MHVANVALNARLPTREHDHLLRDRRELTRQRPPEKAGSAGDHDAAETLIGMRHGKKVPRGGEALVGRGQGKRVRGGGPGGGFFKFFRGGAHAPGGGGGAPPAFGKKKSGGGKPAPRAAGGGLARTLPSPRR